MIGKILTFMKSALWAITKVGRSAVTFAQKLATKIPPIAIKITRIAQAVVTISKALGLAKGDDVAREFGLKVQQDDVRDRMHGESMTHYMTYLRDDVSLDQNRMDNLTEHEKMECDMMGTSMFCESIKENTGVDITPDFLAEWEKSSIDTDYLAGCVMEFSNHGLDSMDPLFEYLYGSLDDDELNNLVQDSIASVERTFNNELSEVDAMNRADSMRSSLNHISITESESLGIGLTPEEKSLIRERTGWSDRILDYMSSVDEAEIYIMAGLVESNVGGRPALIRQDICWTDYSCRHEWLKEKLADSEKWQDYINADLIGEGFPPRDINGDPYELHHIGQKQDSPYAELTWSEHMDGGNCGILHKIGKQTDIDRVEFTEEKSKYWMDRYAMFTESELKEIYKSSLSIK